MRIYIANVHTATGEYTFAALTTAEDAAYDLRTVVMTATGYPAGAIRTNNVSRSNRRILANMVPVKKCVVDGQQWGWMKKV